MNLTETNVTTIVNNLSVSYSDEGPVEAPFIIFIHGFPLNKSMWDIQLEALRDEYHVIAYDVRGYGDSEPGHEDHSIELYANDLVSFMDNLEIRKAVVCGLSMGGYIALHAIKNHPERFDALILCDTQSIADTSLMKERRLEVIENIKKNGLVEYAHQSILNLFAPESLLTKETEIAFVKETIENTSKLSIYNTMHALAMRKGVSDSLSEIKIPVLILVGKDDLITPPERSQLMHKKIQGSQLCIIENAGHLSNIENPFEFNYQVRKFITSIY